jgi:hypothetical protein
LTLALTAASTSTAASTPTAPLKWTSAPLRCRLPHPHFVMDLLALSSLLTSLSSMPYPYWIVDFPALTWLLTINSLPSILYPLFLTLTHGTKSAVSLWNKPSITRMLRGKFKGSGESGAVRNHGTRERRHHTRVADTTQEWAQAHRRRRHHKQVGTRTSKSAHAQKSHNHVDNAQPTFEKKKRTILTLTVVLISRIVFLTSTAALTPRQP